MNLLEEGELLHKGYYYKTNRYVGQKCVKLTVVIDYNQNIGRIDVGDQMLSKFHTMRRCKKLIRKYFFTLI